jgi:hypothetical protein
MAAPPPSKHYADPVFEVDRRAASYLARLTTTPHYQQAADSGTLR